MSVEAIKRQLVELSTDERNEVSIFLSHLRHTADPEFKKLIADRLDDKDPSHWLTLEQLEQRLGPE